VWSDWPWQDRQEVPSFLYRDNIETIQIQQSYAHISNTASTNKSKKEGYIWLLCITADPGNTADMLPVAYK
jgi:hypothetical protein